MIQQMSISNLAEYFLDRPTKHDWACNFKLVEGTILFFLTVHTVHFHTVHGRIIPRRVTANIIMESKLPDDYVTLSSARRLCSGFSFRVFGPAFSVDTFLCLLSGPLSMLSLNVTELIPPSLARNSAWLVQINVKDDYIVVSRPLFVTSAG